MKISNTKIGVVVSFSLLLAGCGGGDGGKSKFEKLVESGWTSFSEGNLQLAVDDFEAAILRNPEDVSPYVGLGWAQMRLNDLNEALTTFNDGAQLESVPADLYAGWAFALNASRQFETSNTQIDAALSLEPAWVFSYNAAIDSDDLHLLQAHNYLLLGQYAASLLAVQRLNPSFQVEAMTESGVAQLSAEIERLRSEP